MIPAMGNNNKTPFKALIFDMDGVFVDTEPLHYRSFVDVFEPLGVKITLDYFYTFVGEPVSKNISDIEHDYQIELDIKEWSQRLERRYLDIVANERLHPLPGVIETMTLARNLHMKIGLATTSSRDQFELILQSTRKHTEFPESLNNFFDVVVTAEDVQHKKPAPDPYLLAAQQLGVAPSECIVIEDSESGVRSAKAAGCFCIARRTAYNEHMDLNSADRIVSSIEEVVEAKFFM